MSSFMSGVTTPVCIVKHNLVNREVLMNAWSQQLCNRRTQDQKHLHMHWYESCVISNYESGRYTTKSALMRATHILNYICCTLTCTWLSMMPKPQTKIQDWNISWLAQLKNTKNLPNMCSLSKEEPTPIFFFWLAYSLKLWGLHPYCEGRCDLLPLRFSLCVRRAGSDWWGLSRAQGETAFYLQYSFLKAWFKWPSHMLVWWF